MNFSVPVFDYVLVAGVTILALKMLGFKIQKEILTENWVMGLLQVFSLLMYTVVLSLLTTALIKFNTL